MVTFSGELLVEYLVAGVVQIRLASVWADCRDAVSRLLFGTSEVPFDTRDNSFTDRCKPGIDSDILRRCPA
jgi:hypothetical protein